MPRNRPTTADSSEPATLHLRLLGHMRAEDSAGRSMLPRTRKARAVLAVIALASPRPVLRLQLTALLWSQREKEQARASLRQAIHELQDTLSPPLSRLMVAERHHLALRTDGLWVDILDATRTDMTQPDALDCFQSPLLEDLVGLDPAFDQWLVAERIRIIGIARGMGERMLADQGDSDIRLRIANQLVTIDPLHETAWRAIMRDHHDRGDPVAAMAAYDRCRIALSIADDARPSLETEDLAARIRTGPTATATTDPEPPSDSSPPPRQERASIDRPQRGGIRLGIAPLRPIGSAANEELSLGLAEEVTTALSRFRWISCISGASWAALSGEKRQEAMWAALDLDFVLDGTIQQTAERVRITVRLMDMRIAGAVIWAHRFDRETNDLLALQDEIGSAIVAQLDPALLIHEGERTAARHLNNPTTHELVLQALPPGLPAGASGVPRGRTPAGNRRRGRPRECRGTCLAGLLAPVPGRAGMGVRPTHHRRPGRRPGGAGGYPRPRGCKGAHAGGPCPQLPRQTGGRGLCPARPRHRAEPQPRTRLVLLRPRPLLSRPP